jgi:hypothetical protein
MRLINAGVGGNDPPIFEKLVAPKMIPVRVRINDQLHG